jgi:hypothetical protein
MPITQQDACQNRKVFIFQRDRQCGAGKRPYKARNIRHMLANPAGSLSEFAPRRPNSDAQVARGAHL